MSPDQHKKQSPLVSLKTDLVLYNDTLREVALEILDEQVSKYPIFVAHQHESKLGELLIDRNELAGEWNIRVSTLEEFLQKGVILPEKENQFIETYKDPRKFMCVLVMVPEGINFVFTPYK